MERISLKNKKLHRVTFFAATSLILLVGISSCSQKSQDEALLEIKSVQPSQSNGGYNIVGSTNLPESSKITVTAVRYLRPTDESIGTSSSDTNINRSILARKFVEVKQGQWQAENLNISQVASDGSIQEPWQADPEQKKLTPEGGVMFIATYDPASQSLALNKPENKEKSQELQPEFQNLEGKLVRFTNEGEKFVQASQIVAIALPTGKTSPNSQAEDFNGGWGNRSQIKPQPLGSGSFLVAPAKSRQTNAPLSALQFLR
ncbi:MAG: hypothetical protein KME60_02570 [Cyanomargarita calcarea GSE-NOS-MK-12-04C]|uniref:Lipoprotein n=1 Tax=Cyanomargarita calcarea GSE-NOS-MK-12-04C TaxID=2839659 RepID=A0A951URJ9_9CYAN|nr:hypothetical protein [Cyanomargarita calcarea GSE-NOS-MK-12-04C]